PCTGWASLWRLRRPARRWRASGRAASTSIQLSADLVHGEHVAGRESTAPARARHAHDEHHDPTQSQPALPPAPRPPPSPPPPSPRARVSGTPDRGKGAPQGPMLPPPKWIPASRAATTPASPPGSQMAQGGYVPPTRTARLGLITPSLRPPPPRAHEYRYSLG